MRKWVPGVGKSRARRLSAVFGTAAALLAGACGAPPDGVGAAAPAPAAPVADSAPAAPAATRPRLVILGDSIAAGYGLRREESFPARLQERIDREGLGFEVVNAGVSGDTSAGGLRRLDWALDGDVRVLVVELGGNDGLRGLPPEELKKNLTAIVRAARERHLAVLLCGMEAPPNAGPAYATAFREAFSSVAREERVPFVPLRARQGRRHRRAEPGRRHPPQRARGAAGRGHGVARAAAAARSRVAFMIAPS